MKRLALLVCVAAAAALAVVSAPALSLSPYRPKAVDFELAPDPDAVLASASRRSDAFLAKPIRVGRRFNLVGMRWRGRAEPGIAIRTRRGEGRWTRWSRLYSHAEDGPDPGSDEPRLQGVAMPAWVGEADWIQYRMTRRVPGLRLHFVNVRGTATAADRARTALRRAVNAGVATVGAALGARAAEAQEPQPAIVSRAEWGASQCPPRSAPAYGTVKAAFVHHTVNANDYTPEEAPDVVLAICRYHRNSNGWNDIGYNFLVDKYGTLYEGRAGGIDKPVMGAQAQGYNAQTTGIANIGDHRSVRQTPAALEAMARLIRWKLPLHGAPTSGAVTLTSAGGASNRYRSGAQVRAERVLGHRDTNSTTCPGDALYAQLPQLRSMVGSLGPVTAARMQLTAALSTGTATYRARTRISGSLISPEGAPLGGEPVEVQARYSGRWKTVQRVRTRGDGTWTGEVRPAGRRYLRARFPGRAGLRAVASPRLLLRVKPAILLSRPPTRGVRGQVVRVSGKVAPRKGRIYQVLQQRRGRAWRTVGVKAVRVVRGRFIGTFTPAFSSSYRVYYVAKADRKTDRGASDKRVLTVRGRSRRGGALAP